jgi:hypothetical protein
VNPDRTFRHLVFAYDFPSEDCIFRDVPHYFVTAAVGEAIEAHGIGSVIRRQVETRISEAYAQSYGTPDTISQVEQLIVTGVAGKDDFGLQQQLLLIVSERALTLLQQYGLTHAQIVPYDPEYRIPTPEELMASKRRS